MTSTSILEEINKTRASLEATCSLAVDTQSRLNEQSESMNRISESADKVSMKLDENEGLIKKIEGGWKSIIGSLWYTDKTEPKCTAKSSNLIPEKITTTDFQPDDGLDGIMSMVSTLKEQSYSINNTITSQNQHLDNLSVTMNNTEDRLNDQHALFMSTIFNGSDEEILDKLVIEQIPRSDATKVLARFVQHFERKKSTEQISEVFTHLLKNIQSDDEMPLSFYPRILKFFASLDMNTVPSDFNNHVTRLSSVLFCGCIISIQFVDRFKEWPNLLHHIVLASASPQQESLKRKRNISSSDGYILQETSKTISDVFDYLKSTSKKNQKSHIEYVDKFARVFEELLVYTQTHNSYINDLTRCEFTSCNVVFRFLLDEAVNHLLRYLKVRKYLFLSVYLMAMNFGYRYLEVSSEILEIHHLDGKDLYRQRVNLITHVLFRRLILFNDDVFTKVSSFVIASKSAGIETTARNDFIEIIRDILPLFLKKTRR